MKGKAKLYICYKLLCHIVLFLGVVFFVLVCITMGHRLYISLNYNNYEESVFLVQDVKLSERKAEGVDNRFIFYLSGEIDGNEETYRIEQERKVEREKLQSIRELYPPKTEIKVMYNPDAPNFTWLGNNLRMTEVFTEDRKEYNKITRSYVVRSTKLFMFGIILSIPGWVYERSRKIGKSATPA